MMELWYALVDLLPFGWAQPGSMYFMKNALLAVLGICVAPFLNLGAHYLLYKGTAALAATAVSTLTGVAYCLLKRRR